LSNQLLEDRAALNEYMASQSSATSAPPQDQASDDAGPFGPGYGPPQVFNVSTKLIPRCSAPGCAKHASLSRCAACKAVQYCGREHQVADRSAHRSICTKIKKAGVNLEKEERALKREEGDDIFEEGKGHFWGIHETRDYMRARFTLVEALLKINTDLAVASALEHLLDMLQLCRSDNMGVRDVVPALFVRLGRDQEAYDFCTWWATTGQESDYDWGDTNLPYLDTKNADVFVGVKVFVDNYPSLSHNVAVCLVKIRLMIDLQALQRARQEAGPHVPRELLDTIQQHSANTVIASNPTILEREDQTPHIAKLQEQVQVLYAAIHKANPHFWPALLKPGDNLTQRPNLYGFGDKGQMQLVLQYNYNAWAETPGAIGVIEALSKK
jgi:hypothetical protein